MGGRSDQVPPALNKSAHIPICTIARGAEGVPGDHRPKSTMCRAKRTAHTRASTSPTFMPNEPPVSSNSPANEMTTADHVHQWMGAPNIRLITGVKTTNKPVIKPALPGLVMASPAVWVR
ncbi:MAG: hypothetical protein AUI15_36470 [Actinobacteria bacterium 13_2_20CM_2_66_6]|nr:MAG: hypothetical protein AUI15_36470 [Actinobacteria bacterium 13_2_20CM_2_66_6]